jgi:hypothetical protein
MKKITVTTSKEKTNYKKALSYAYTLNPLLFVDIVHDSFIRWFDKCQTNLFEEAEHTIIATVKRTWWSKYIQPNKYMFKGKIQNRQITSFSEEMRYNSITPEDIYIAKEFKSLLLEQLMKDIDDDLKNDKLKNVKGNWKLTADDKLKLYLYAVSGYSYNDISEIMGISANAVGLYFKKMRWKAALLN